MSIESLNLDLLKSLPEEGPVVLLNLIRFRRESADGNGSGWDAYLRYSNAAAPMIKANGGTILWTGNGQAVALGDPAGHAWDFIALVRYPSKAAFIKLMTAPDYERQANPHRVNAVLDHVILAVGELYSKFKSG